MTRAAVSPLRYRPFALMLLASAGTFSGYALLLPVVPLWAVRHGAGTAAAGAATGVFMASTVLVQFAVPAFVRRFGYRAGLLWGAGLIGLPAPFLAVFPTAPAILGLSLVRGLGFGLITVCGSALIAELLPREAVARGSGFYGLAAGLPQLVCLPLGATVAENWGFEPVFVSATALPIVALLPLGNLPRCYPGSGDAGGASEAGLRGLRWVITLARSTWRPWLPMLIASTGFGALATFLPIVLAPSYAAVALLVVPGAAMVARWVAGQLGHRVTGSGRMLFPALALAAVGVLTFALVADHDGLPVLAVIAVGVFGIGFGAVQNDALVAMFARTSAAPASVAWNVGFDAGQGLGAVAVGAVLTATSPGIAFGVLAVVAVAVLPVAWKAGRAG